MSSFVYRFMLPAPRPRAFELLSEPRLLDRLTPSWFVLRPRDGAPTHLGPGSEIPYLFRWRGLPLRWTSVITDWAVPSFFAYEQRHGPYRSFRHEHRFRDVAEGTEVVDHVVYRSPGGALVDRLLVEPDLRRVFACRESRARELLEGTDQPSLGDLSADLPDHAELRSAAAFLVCGEDSRRWLFTLWERYERSFENAEKERQSA